MRLFTTPDGRIILAIMVVFGAIMYHTASASYNSLQIAGTQQKVTDLNNYIINIVKNSTQQQKSFIKDLTEDIKAAVHNDTKHAIENLTGDLKPSTTIRAELLDQHHEMIQLLTQLKAKIVYNNGTRNMTK